MKLTPLQLYLIDFIGTNNTYVSKDTNGLNSLSCEQKKVCDSLASSTQRQLNW